VSEFLSLTLSGISLAALFFLVAAGLSLIFGLMGVLNFAHGAFFLWGAYIWYQVFTYGINLGLYHLPPSNFALALVCAFLAGAVLGAITERVFMRTLYRRPLSQILVTLGLGLVLTQLVQAIWGLNPFTPGAIPNLSGSVQLGDVSTTAYELFGIAVGFGVLAVVWLILRYTRVGLIVRAGVENPTMVRALGINVGIVFLGVFALGAALAALGGAIYGPWVDSVAPDMGQSILLTAIIVVVLGGLGSYIGSAIGALVIGLTQEYIPYYALQVSLAHPAWSSWLDSGASLSSLIILIAVLLVRPTGLLGAQGHSGAAL
jgi:branched-chain amino acid transport system permease protein